MKKNKLSGIAALLICAALLMGVFTACSSSAKSSRSADAREVAPAAQNSASTAGAATGDKASFGEANPAASTATETPTTPATAAAAALATQKIIERLNYSIETLKFDDSVSRIQSLCAELGGYVQDSNITGNSIQNKGNLRQADYTMRIPQVKLSQLKSRAGEIGTVLNSASSSENVTEKYYDTEARLKSLRTQEERLLTLLQKSGTLTDVIALEKALADVNYQIEQLTGSLKQYDSLINFSTVSIHLQEVVKPTEIEITPVTLGDKIAQQFQYSMRGLGNFGEGLLVFFLGGAPVIIIIVLIAAGLYWLLLGRKKRAEKKARALESSEPPKEDEIHNEK